MGQRIQYRGAQPFGLPRGLCPGLPLQRPRAFQRDGGERGQRGGSQLRHFGADQCQASHRPRAEAKHTIPTSGLRIEAIGSHKVSIASVRFGLQRVAAIQDDLTIEMALDDHSPQVALGETSQTGDAAGVGISSKAVWGEFQHGGGLRES